MHTFDVLCVGAVNHDTIAEVDHIPVDDERMLARGFTRATGGPAATAAVTLARLGYRVALSAAVGLDADGDAVLDKLRAEGVDVGYVSRLPGMTTSASIILANTTSTGRTIVTSTPSGGPDQFPLDIAPVIHVDQVGFSPVHARLGAADAARLSIDAGNPIDDLTLARTWLYTPTVASLTARYAGAGGLDAAADAARTEGASIVVATDGSRGSYWWDGDTAVHAPSYPVPVASTLGAGDVFHGALVAAVLDGQAPEAALRFANACAGISCRSLDGQSGIPARSEITALIAANAAN